ncbi:hypothetical protein Tco_1186379 [Tanacetum coccineum]
MSSSNSAVTYTSVSSEDVPFWGIRFFGMEQPYSPEIAPQSPIQAPPVPQDEDEREPMFIQLPDPDYVPEPIHHEYIPLKDEHVFSAEEQPLPPDDETEDGPVDYPIDGGDDGDDDDVGSSGDDADDEDEDDEEEEEHLAMVDSTIVVPTDEPDDTEDEDDANEEDKDDDEEEEEEHLAPADSAVVASTLGGEIFPASGFHIPSTRGRGERLARCTTPSAHSSPPLVPSPLLPSSGCPTQTQTLRITSTQALIDAVTAELPSPPLPLLPPSLYIPPHVDRNEVIESSTAETTRGRGIDYEASFPEIAPMTLGRASILAGKDPVIIVVNLLMEDRMRLHQETVLIVEEEA